MTNRVNNSHIKKDCPTPIYMQVVDYLRENIASGAWEQASKIPSEVELMSTLGVSRGSIKKAISKLVDEGLLEQIQGKGTYVKSKDISFPLTEGLISFSESLIEQGLSFETNILDCEIRKSDEDISRHLGIVEGSDYLHLERVRSVEGEPVMFIENNINMALVPGIETADFVNEGLFAIIERLSGHQIEYSKTSFVAKLADTQRSPRFFSSFKQSTWTMTLQLNMRAYGLNPAGSSLAPFFSVAIKALESGGITPNIIPKRKKANPWVRLFVDGFSPARQTAT